MIDYSQASESDILKQWRHFNVIHVTISETYKVTGCLTILGDVIADHDPNTQTD